MPWKKILACATGQIEPMLLRKLEFVLEENRAYRALLERHAPHWRLNHHERIALAQKGKTLGKLLNEIVTIVQPETLLKWHRQLIARKWDFSHRKAIAPGRPTIAAEIQKLIVQFARENPAWGYDRISGALANLGHSVADQTIGNVLKQSSLGPAKDRQRGLTWAQFIRRHKEVIWATDFFSAEIWTPTGLTTFYILFFIQIQTRRIVLGGITRAPGEQWMQQVARNVTGDDGGGWHTARYLIHDRDGKYGLGFDRVFESSGIRPLKLPPQSPNLI